MDLPLLFGIIIAFGISVYIILDGFDLGVGILSLWDKDERERDVMMNSIAPFWDGNETWLILGGGAFYGVFPKAAAILFPALYVPIMLMLFALIFRGVAFEFRFKAGKTKVIWNWAFCLGSLIAGFAQGSMLGAFIKGFNVSNGEFVGGAMDWLTPFSFFTGLALVLGYALLGATWLMMKTSGTVQEKAYSIGRPLMMALCVGIGVVSLWTPIMDSHIAARWFDMPGLFILAPIPLLTLFLTYMLWVSIGKKLEKRPFFLSIGLFMMAYLGLGMSMWPYVVPRHFTFWDVASPYETQIFILVGIGLLIPFILGYTAYVFYVFRGKVKEHVGYH